MRAAVEVELRKARADEAKSSAALKGVDLERREEYLQLAVEGCPFSLRVVAVATVSASSPTSVSQFSAVSV